MRKIRNILTRSAAIAICVVFASLIPSEQIEAAETTNDGSALASVSIARNTGDSNAVLLASGENVYIGLDQIVIEFPGAVAMPQSGVEGGKSGIPISVAAGKQVTAGTQETEVSLTGAGIGGAISVSTAGNNTINAGVTAGNQGKEPVTIDGTGSDALILGQIGEITTGVVATGVTSASATGNNTINAGATAGNQGVDSSVLVVSNSEGLSVLHATSGSASDKALDSIIPTLMASRTPVTSDAINNAANAAISGDFNFSNLLWIPIAEASNRGVWTPDDTLTVDVARKMLDALGFCGILDKETKDVNIYSKDVLAVNNDNTGVSCLSCSGTYDITSGGEHKGIIRVMPGANVTIVDSKNGSNYFNINTDCPVSFSTQGTAPVVGSIPQMNIDQENLRRERENEKSEKALRDSLAAEADQRRKQDKAEQITPDPEPEPNPGPLD